MKEYLKMSDVFQSGVNHDHDGNFITIGRSRVADFGFHAALCSYAAHAINSHDELVAEVERLRHHLMACATELGAMIDANNVQNMDDGSWKYDHQTLWEAMQLLK